MQRASIGSRSRFLLQMVRDRHPRGPRERRDSRGVGRDIKRCQVLSNSIRDETRRDSEHHHASLCVTLTSFGNVLISDPDPGSSKPPSLTLLAVKDELFKLKRREIKFLHPLSLLSLPLPQLPSYVASFTSWDQALLCIESRKCCLLSLT